MQKPTLSEIAEALAECLEIEQGLYISIDNPDYPTKAPKREGLVVQAWPMLMKEATAGAYIDRSRSWMRNVRYDDSERIARGAPPRGPPFIRQGSGIRYPRDWLDDWISKFKEGDMPGWEKRASNTSGLKKGSRNDGQ